MKLNPATYFLVALIEECAEVIHRACKMIRFGPNERYREEDPSNQELLETEITDLKACIILNKMEGNLDEPEKFVEAEGIQRKIAKVRKFKKYSEDDCGTIVPFPESPQPYCSYEKVRHKYDDPRTSPAA